MSTSTAPRTRRVATVVLVVLGVLTTIVVGFGIAVTVALSQMQF